VETLLNASGTDASIAYLFANSFDGSSLLLAGLKKTSSAFSIVSFSIDGYQLVKNPSVEGVFDLTITGIGVFGGPKGTAVSIGLSYAKKGVIAGFHAINSGMETLSQKIVQFEQSLLYQIMSGMYIKK
jgi:hypothetical protein